MSDPFKDVEVAAGAVNSDLAYWQKEIDLARKRSKKWLKQAKEVVQLYEGQKENDNSFNILYANTDTLLPAVYNNLPRPVVDRRYKDNDPLAKNAATALERALAYLMDSGDSEYDPFNSLMEQAVLGALVPGRGLTRFRYDPKFEDMPAPVGDEEKDDAGEAEEPDEPSEHNPVTTEILPENDEGQQVVYETVCGEDVDYDEFLTGYARRWVKVPWIAFIHSMTKEDLEENFGSKIAHKVPLADPMKKEAGGWKQEEGADDANNRGSAKCAEVYEIWAKGKKKVYFYAPAYKEDFLKEVDDPLNLSGFYPCPEPMHFLAKRSSIIPTPLYKLYEPQAKELNRLSMRINRILNALKVRGFYDGSIQGLKDLLNSDDNTLIGARNVAALQDGKNLSNSIWMMPLGELITVLQQLLMGREACKNTIYEITGLSDIMRGDTQASETATAQKIKSRWGSQRLQRFQAVAQNYVRGCLRIIGELAGEHFAPETFDAMTNLDFATDQEVQQAQQMQQAIQEAMLRLPPPMPGAPGAPQAPPQLPPQIQQAQQQVQAILAKPKWADVVGLLRDNLHRNYRIDIETNSTIDATTNEDKQDIVDAMTAVANTMQTFGPFVERGVFPMPAFKQMLLSIARRYEFGRQVEDQLNAIPDQVPQTTENTPEKGPSPEEQQAVVAEAQAKLVVAQLKQQTAKTEAEHREQQLRTEIAEMQRKDQLESAKHQLALAQTSAKVQTVEATRQATLAKAEADMATAQATKVKAEADIQLAGVNLDKARVDLEVGRQNAEITKQKATTDGEVHAVKAKRDIEKANAPEPVAEPKGADETAAAVRELLAHIAKPAKATRDKATGAITIQR